MLDFVFYKLGIQSETIEHPVVMSETLSNPYYSRGCKLLSTSFPPTFIFANYAIVVAYSDVRITVRRI